MKCFYVLFLLSLCAFRLTAQSLDNMVLKCQYRLLYVKDTLHPEAVEGDVMVLEVGDKMAKFYSYADFKSDSALDADLKAQKSKAEMLANRGFRIMYNTYVVYSNYPAGKMTVTDKIMRDYYVYEENFPAVKWKISSDTATVLSYHCQKAVCEFRGRKYTAWFTTDIPVHFGPWKLSGLPGLILKVQDERKQFCFECFSMEKPKSSIVWNKREYRKTDHEKFNQAYIRFKVNPLLALEGMGVKIDMANAPKKPFNPMELTDK